MMLPLYRETIRNNYARVLALILFGSIAASGFATSGPDPNPGPSTFASTESTLAPEDIATPENTVTHPQRLEERFPWQPAQRQPTGALTGRIIYVNGGHGFFNAGGGVWDSDRETNHFINEDLGNQDQLTQFVYQAFSAGATVVPMRPVGNQVNQVVIDNDDPQVTYSGAWSNSAGTPAFGSTGDAVKYRFSVTSAQETATARYTPNIPVAGYYPVYSWVLFSNNRSLDQLYRIRHSGGTSEVKVDHRKVGKGWVYLGTYYFESGTAGYCEISNQSSVPGSNVIADGIRFGNGIGTSGMPREEEAASYWIRDSIGVGSGADTSVWTNGLVAAPLRMAAYMNNESVGTMTDRVYLSFHSNAASGTARGAIGLWNDERIPKVAAGTKTPNQEQLAILQGREINLDMRDSGAPTFEHPWSTRTSHHWSHTDYAFGEIRWDTVNREMDATINETGFHDNSQDAAILANSKARIWMARAATQGLVRYFNQFGGGPLTFSPEPPVNAKAVANANGTVTVSWAPPTSNSVGGQPPTGYVVYTSTNGYGFGNPVSVSGISNTQTTLTGLPAGQPVYVRVSATNNGGESVPTEVLAVRPGGGSVNSTLIVYGFDRQDRALSPRETNTGLTAYYRAKPWKSNNYDYVVQHAKALHAAGVGFDSTSNEALTQVFLNGYKNVIWILGTESTIDKTFNPSEQALVTNYLSGQRNLMVSGAEIAWDMDQANNGRAFYNDTLGVRYVSDDANTYTVGAGAGVLAGLSSFTFGSPASVNNTAYPPPANSPYDVPYPDVIAATSAAGAPIFNYTIGVNSVGAAGIRTQRGGAKIIVLGFPFETIISEASRNQMMTLVMQDFNAPAAGVDDWTLY